MLRRLLWPLKDYFWVEVGFYKFRLFWALFKLETVYRYWVRKTPPAPTPTSNFLFISFTLKSLIGFLMPSTVTILSLLLRLWWAFTPLPVIVTLDETGLPSFFYEPDCPAFRVSLVYVRAIRSDFKVILPILYCSTLTELHGFSFPTPGAPFLVFNFSGLFNFSTPWTLPYSREGIYACPIYLGLGSYRATVSVYCACAWF